jgi:hypothetical protein
MHPDMVSIDVPMLEGEIPAESSRNSKNLRLGDYPADLFRLRRRGGHCDGGKRGRRQAKQHSSHVANSCSVVRFGHDTNAQAAPPLHPQFP